MSTAIVTRAEVGAALRSRPSALTGNAVLAAAPAVSAASHRLAAELERVAPGVSLMLQMRARLFDEAAAAAPARGLRALVSIAAGLDDRRLQITAFAPGCVWEVDHPAVLAAKGTPIQGVARCGVGALDAAGWVTRLIREAPLADATIFLVHNPALWASPPLQPWLSELAAAAAPGSEVLLNLLPDDAGPLPVPGAAVLGAGATASGDASDAVSLHARVRALGLQTMTVFDSARLQRAYLGAEDLLVRELYVWLAKPRASRSRRAAPPPLGALAGWRRAPSERSSPIGAGDRPRLRRDVVVQRRADGACRLLRTVTPWRQVGITMDARAAAVARLLDGARTPADLAAALADSRGVGAGGRVVGATITTLRRAGFVLESGPTGSPATSRSLHELGRAVLAALARGDRPTARRLAGALDAARGPRATAHLRALVARVCRGAVLEIAGGPSIYTVGRRGVGPEAEGVVGEGRRLLAGLAALLDCRRLPTVVVDLSSDRPGRPLTHVANADPYTLVWIPASAYSSAVLAHELSHVLADAPSRWLSEGLAVWAQRRIAPGPCFPDDTPCDASVAARSPSDLPLVTLLGDPASAPPSLRAVLERPSRRAYREAADFVEFFVQTFGIGALRPLFRTGARSVHADVLTRVCRRLGSPSVAHLEEQWRRTRIRRGR